MQISNSPNLGRPCNQILNRAEDVMSRATVVRQLLARDLSVYGFYNNHYAGHSPGSLALFAEIWRQSDPT